MRKLISLLVLVGVLGVALGGALIVHADSPSEPYPQFGRGHGRGMWPATFPGLGRLHELMQESLAEELDLTVEKLQALYEEGKTFLDIAEERELTVGEARAIMRNARQAALDEAVEQGLITQAQADFLLERQGGFGGFARFARGFCAGLRVAWGR